MNFTNNDTDALDDTARDTGHRRQRLDGGPRARTSTAGGHPRRSPPVACVTGPHGTADPALIVIVVTTPAPRTAITIAAPTATATPTATSNNAADHEVSVCVRPTSSFTAAHPHR